MIAYVETSAFVKLVVPEPGSPEARRVWTVAARLVSSHLLYPEARAALARALRMGRLDREGLAIARTRVERLWRDVDRVAVSERVAARAGELAETLGLRAYDAVHLASLEVVADADTVLLSADGELLVAARGLGIAVAAVGDT